MAWESLSPIDCDKNAAILCSLVQDLSLEQCVHTPTRDSNILDLLLTNRPEMVSHIEVTDNLPLTDHDSVSFSLDILPPIQGKVQ